VFGRTHTHAPDDALVDLGLRLEHYIAAQGKNPDHVAEAIGIVPDDFALALTGHCDLPFSVINTALNVLTIEWWHLFGSDVIHRPRVHNLTLDSDAWHAVDAGLQSFDIRRDSEKNARGTFCTCMKSLVIRRQAVYSRCKYGMSITQAVATVHTATSSWNCAVTQNYGCPK
jgi:hypothetical protein